MPGLLAVPGMGIAVPVIGAGHVWPQSIPEYTWARYGAGGVAMA